MKLVSVNVGRPREVDWHGRSVRTSIWKTPVSGRVRANRLNLEGDEQSDLSVHGGPDKAVYAYPSEHYEYWRHELSLRDLPWGAFGENFTTEACSRRRSRSATDCAWAPPTSPSRSLECPATSWACASAATTWSSTST